MTTAPILTIDCLGLKAEFDSLDAAVDHILERSAITGQSASLIDADGSYAYTGMGQDDEWAVGPWIAEVRR